MRDATERRCSTCAFFLPHYPGGYCDLDTTPRQIADGTAEVLRPDDGCEGYKHRQEGET